MVAVIKNGSSIRRAFHYNENKLSEGKAICIAAENYPMDTIELDERMRLNMLLKVAENNPDVLLKSVHISLNFAPGEELFEGKLRAIASEYMDRIGFGNQPYLVYQHFDAGHPHIHILTTKIRPDGRTIDMYNIGRKRSEPARKAIELKFGLVKAEAHKGKVFRLPPVDASIVQYGKPVTKRAITNVLDAVLERYSYTSLSELNAVLNLYNVSAERGSEGTRTYRSGGLVYRVLDKEGYPVSAPIKASAFYSKPTLGYLEGRFKQNEKRREQFKTRIKNRIDLLFIGGIKPSIKTFATSLKREGIDAVFRFSDQGRLYGITYVDHRNKCVFNGSDLGKTYGANAIAERCGSAQATAQQGPQISAPLLSKSAQPGSDKGSQVQGALPSIGQNPGEKSLWEQLTEVEQAGDFLPYELSANKKEKKKRKSRTF